MERIVNIDGKLLPLSEVMLQYPDYPWGYGVFETILVVQGKLVLGNQHFERLKRACAILEIPWNKVWTQPFFESEMKKLGTSTPQSIACRLRLQIQPSKSGNSHFFMELFKLDNLPDFRLGDGIKLGILNDFSKSVSVSSSCKISHTTLYIQSSRVLEQSTLDELIILNEKGVIAETNIGNLFWFEKGYICTPPLSDGGVSGIMRAWLISELKKSDYTVMEKSIDSNSLKQVEEIFVINSIRLIRWVCYFENTHFPCSQIETMCDRLNHNKLYTYSL